MKVLPSQGFFFLCKVTSPREVSKKLISICIKFVSGWNLFKVNFSQKFPLISLDDLLKTDTHFIKLQTSYKNKKNSYLLGCLGNCVCIASF